MKIWKWSTPKIDCQLSTITPITFHHGITYLYMFRMKEKSPWFYCMVLKLKLHQFTRPLHTLAPSHTNIMNYFYQYERECRKLNKQRKWRLVTNYLHLMHICQQQNFRINIYGINTYGSFNSKSSPQELHVLSAKV